MKVDLDACEGLRGAVMGTDHRYLGLLLRFGKAMSANRVRAWQTKRNVMVGIEPVLTEGALEVLQVVYVHFNEYINEDDIEI